jgi:uncharacterized protein
MTIWLVDTGALVAYLDADDPWHDRMAAAFTTGGIALWTTMPVITEAMHMLAAVRGGEAALVEFLHRTRTTIHPMTDRAELQRAVVLTNKYRNVPMDFADASLVVLAEQTGVREILTTDRRGFRVFRIHGRQSFSLVPDDFGR